MAWTKYNRGMRAIADGDVDLAAADIRVLLVDDAGTYTVDPDHEFVSAVAGDELSGTGYERKALANQSLTTNNAANRVEFDADDVTWSSIDAGSVQALVGYVHVTDDTDSILLWYDDEGYAPFVTNGGDMTHEFHDDGILHIKQGS